MEYDKSAAPYFGEISEWAKAMPIPEDDIIFDDDCPPLESGVYVNPVRRFNGRVIPPRPSPLDAFYPELLAFMKSLTPHVQMEARRHAGISRYHRSNQAHV